MPLFMIILVLYLPLVHECLFVHITLLFITEQEPIEIFNLKTETEPASKMYFQTMDDDHKNTSKPVLCHCYKPFE
jgi:hypothetical protein